MGAAEHTRHVAHSGSESWREHTMLAETCVLSVEMTRTAQTSCQARDEGGTTCSTQRQAPP